MFPTCVGMNQVVGEAVSRGFRGGGSYPRPQAGEPVPPQRGARRPGGGGARRGNGRFRADHHGHADAVAQAIEWLVGEVLPESTAQDHELHDEGDWPAEGFRRESRPGWLGPTKRLAWTFAQAADQVFPNANSSRVYPGAASDDACYPRRMRHALDALFGDHGA